MQLPQVITGRVIHGEKVGRTIGFPTANLDVLLSTDQLDAGVYFGECVINGKSYNCLPYFGPRLIFGETKNVFEVYIFDLDSEIYDKELTVTLKKFQRPPVQVNSLDELKQLLENDKRAGQLLTTSLVM
jgi:riboflavin kinase/FMN adenylyltransferase